MKKYIFIFLTLILSMSLVFSLYINPEEKKSEEKKVEKIKVAWEGNTYPYDYVDESGKYTGVNIEFLRKACNDLGIELEIIPLSYEKSIEALENKEVTFAKVSKDEKYINNEFLFEEIFLENNNSYQIISKKDNKVLINNIHNQINIIKEKEYKSILNKWNLNNIENREFRIIVILIMILSGVIFFAANITRHYKDRKKAKKSKDSINEEIIVIYMQ